MLKFGVGQPVTRLEDARLLKGRGRYQTQDEFSEHLPAVDRDVLAGDPAGEG
jgi:hypothetical protein